MNIIWTRSQEDAVKDKIWIDQELVRSSLSHHIEVLYWPCLKITPLPSVQFDFLTHVTQKVVLVYTSHHSKLIASQYSMLASFPCHSLSDHQFRSGEELFRHLLQVYAQNKDEVFFLLPGAEKRAFPLAEKLQKFGFQAKNITIYETKEQSDIPFPISFEVNDFRVCFASPTAVRGFLNSMDKNMKNLKIVTIGETTKKEALKFFEHVVSLDKPLLRDLFLKACDI